MRSPSRPVEPSPAATLVLLRDRPDEGIEVLLVERHRESKFAGGAFVFPGGRVGSEDLLDGLEARCVGISADRAQARLGGLTPAEKALGYWVAAIRETFEEVGMLMAYDRDGRVVRFTGTDGERFAAYRRACQQDGNVFWQMLGREALTLAADRLVYFAHWVTPEENSIRFDTRFFAAEAPPEQEATADEREVVAVRWLKPAEALEAYRRGELSLRLPTIKNLELLVGRSVAEVVAGLNGRSVPTIRPRIIADGNSRRVLLPTDPGWY
ncbi:MAG: hypothetical protein ACE5JN_03715 [Candidatus Methylomirabilia bacterium]